MSNKNINVIILSGGLGTRLSEYTHKIPKPMVKIGNQPIIVHIIRHYLNYGYKNFILSTGYKSSIFEKFFKGFKKYGKKFEFKIFKKKCFITIQNTGAKTMTGGRLKRVKNLLNVDEEFMFTYGDGICDVNLSKLHKFFLKHKKTATVTAVRPPARFGELIIKNKKVVSFKEKPQTTQGWINGGFFVAKYEFLNFIRDDHEILEKWPLEKITKLKKLTAYQHAGFWKCMDVKRDKDELEKIYKINKFNFKK